MTRNQKIALGCGGGGCLVLIVIAAICGILIAAGYVAWPGSSNRNVNYNYNYNANSNSNSNSNRNSNTNSNTSSSSSLSDDAKHRLFQAAGMTRDNPLIQRVLRKLGFMTADGTVTDDYADFVKAHMNWAMKNVQFVQSVSTPDKARAYVEEHIND